jgi:hypothetical protein
MIAAYSEVTQGELVDRLVSYEAGRLGIHLVPPISHGLRDRRWATAGDPEPRKLDEIMIGEEEVLMRG